MVEDVLLGAFGGHAVADLGVAHVGVLHLLDENLEHDRALFGHLQQNQRDAGCRQEHLFLDNITDDGNCLLGFLHLLQDRSIHIAFVDVLQILVLDAEVFVLVIIQIVAAVEQGRSVRVVLLNS